MYWEHEYFFITLFTHASHWYADIVPSGLHFLNHSSIVLSNIGGGCSEVSLKAIKM
jgi:hypothetical protein